MNSPTLRPATEPAPVKEPLIAPTGSISIDATLSSINASAEALESGFDTMMDPAAGSLDKASGALNGMLAVVGAPFEMMDTGLAMLTADLGAMAPCFPVVTLGHPHIGTPHGHGHPPSLIPPAPPVPLPSFGPVSAAGCVSVLVHGMPVARASDVGMAITCGSFFPIFEIYTGSSNTFVGGSRAARAGDITRHCNPASALDRLGGALGAMGAAAGLMSAAQTAQSQGANPALAAAMEAAQVAADAAAMAMSIMIGKDPGVGPGIGAMSSFHFDVLVGGFPMPDVMEVLGPLLKLAKKAAKGLLKGGKMTGWAFKGQLCLNPSEPISLVTGEVYNDFEDLVLGPFGGWTWTRHYRSGWAHLTGPMGRGFRHNFDRRLWIGPRAMVFSNFNGEDVRFVGTSPGTYAPSSCGYQLSVLAQEGVVEVYSPKGEAFRFRMRKGQEDARLVQVRLGKNVVLDLGYGAQGQLATIAQADKRLMLHLHHDTRGRLVKIVKEVGMQNPEPLAAYNYDDRDCLTSFENPRGGTYGYEYEPGTRPGLMTRAFDPKGYGFTWSYDESRRCVHCRGDDGLWEVAMEYTPSSTTVTEGDGGAWTYLISPEQTVLEAQDPCGGVRRFFQGEDGRVMGSMDPAGRVTRWLYDSTGHHFGRIDHFGAFLPPEEDDPTPATGRELYTPAMPLELLFGVQEERLARTRIPFTQAIAKVPGIGADPGGRQTFAHVDSPDVEPSVRYDEAGAICERTDAAGRCEQFRFSTLNECVAKTDPDGVQTQTQYGSWSLVQATTDGIGAQTKYDYDHREKIIRISDPKGHQVQYERDLCGRIVKIVNEDRVEESYERDSAGRVTRTFDGQGKLLLEYAYGEQGECIERKMSSGNTHRYAYNAQGMITEASDAYHDVQLDYDAHRRVILDKRDGKGLEIRGTRTSFDWVVFDEVVVHYEIEGDKTTITTPCGAQHTIELIHGCSIKREHPDQRCEYSHYDTLGRCTAKMAWTGSFPKELDWSAQYKRSAGGDLLEIEDSLRGRTTFEYDAAHRVTKRRNQVGQTRQYRYDDAGNLVTNRDYGLLQVDLFNQLQWGDLEGFRYNERFHLSEHIQKNVTIHYKYDDADNLVGVRWSDGREPWQAGYDGLGRRMYKCLGTKRTDYYWEDGRLIAEVHPDGSYRIYVYPGPGSFVPIMFLDYQELGETPGFDQISFVYADQSGMPSHITDWTGAIVWQAHEVDVYGAVEGVDYRRMTYNLRWPGHYWDEETGLHYNRFRSYSPKLGRYLQSDPLGQAGGVNVYAYPGDPLGTVDLYGLAHKKGTKGLSADSAADSKKPVSKEPANTPGTSAAKRQKYVYQLVDSDGKVVYFGMADGDVNLSARLAAHSREKSGDFVAMQVIGEGLSHDEARTIEGKVIRARLARATARGVVEPGASIETQLSQAGLLNKNRGRTADRWIEVDSESAVRRPRYSSLAKK